jgi:uncharacterized protein YjbI with pentapeptide repeats
VRRRQRPKEFFSHNGLPATFISDALQGSTGLVGVDLQQIELPQLQLEQANLSRVNFSGANLREANLSNTSCFVPTSLEPIWPNPVSQELT